MVKKLLHTRYRVADLDKTVHFYKDVLGLEEVQRSTSARGLSTGLFQSARKRRADRDLQI
jgi:lactoylglutathione lyase